MVNALMLPVYLKWGGGRGKNHWKQSFIKEWGYISASNNKNIKKTLHCV